MLRTLSVERARCALGAAAAAVLVLALAPPAQAAFPSLYGGDVSCAAQPANGNVRLCGGETTTWDGKTKIDLNVILPPTPSSGADGPYPLIGVFHGWGGHKIGLEEEGVQRWAERGYAVFSMSDRGWGDSCGAMDPDRLSEACAAGYNHLMDDRYEVHDAQYLISVLADEGVAEPKEIGATGVSYGGGMSMALAALRNRTMLPDGSLVPWRSPEGREMELAAAVPQWPWTDLAYSLMPNGSTLDYATDSPYLGPEGKAKIGIEKQSYVSGLYGLGLAESNYAAPKADPEADLTSWYALIDAGEPYDSNPLARSVVEQITTYHSSYYIDRSEPPAPLLIQSGWNDDLFPVDEAVRFYNRTRAQYPGDPISLFLMDDGHARSQNKPADVAVFRARENAWFDHYLKGAGTEPESSAEALTTVCGGASEGPYRAASWQGLAPGEIDFASAVPQTIAPDAGNPAIGKAFDPIAGEGACATVPGEDQPGVATYRLPAVPEGGFTLLGSPTITADLATVDADSEVAARLLDVSPAGTERLVARGLLRPGSGGSGVVFQLHPQAYRFEAGHVAKLELLPSDAPYARPSNLQAPITVSNLSLRLPVHDPPHSLGGLVQPRHRSR
jgi:predicted acyl esterase